MVSDEEKKKNPYHYMFEGKTASEIEEGLNRDDEENDYELSEESLIFKCVLCGFMYNIAEPPAGLQPLENYVIAGSEPMQLKCPHCGKRVLLEVATKEQYKKYIEKKNKKEEDQEKSKEEKEKKRAFKLIKDDLGDLIKDLKERLFNGEITPKRFVAILMYASQRIVKRYDKNKYIDWLDFRKMINDLSDDILKVHKVQEKSDEILEGYDESIEDDELYKAELGYYIEDNKFSIPEYELNQRMKEYEKQDKLIKKEEYKKEIEEKYQARKLELLEKAEERKRRQKLHDIM